MSLLEKYRKPSQADSLSLQLKEAEKLQEKLDPKGTDPNTFLTLHNMRMKLVDLTYPDKYKTGMKLHVIREEQEKILAREWTPESSGQMVFLYKEKKLLENPRIDPDIASRWAHSFEAYRLECEANNISRAPINHTNNIKADQQRAFGRYLQNEAIFLEVKHIKNH